MNGRSKPPACMGGLDEAGVGTPDLLVSLRYRERFGCRAGGIRELDAGIAEALYGVDSELTSVRLHDPEADHGLVRPVRWRTSSAQPPFPSRLRMAISGLSLGNSSSR